MMRKPGPPPPSSLPTPSSSDERVRALLENAPLYRTTDYRTNGVALLPPVIEMFCDSASCGKPQMHDLQVGGSHSYATYLCRNCREKTHEFLLRWERFHEEERHHSLHGGENIRYYEVGRLTKAGQWPPIADRLASPLEKRLGATRAKYYKTALRLRNLSLGIGALSYLRRVVEETTNDILEIVAEEAEIEGVAVDPVELRIVRDGHIFDEKMSFAKKMLPNRLVPGGHNPLDKLHDVASAGLHGETEEQCVAIFDAARPVFEFFFAELPERLTAEKEFRKQVSELGQT